MRTIDLEELKSRVMKHPLQQIRGRFRTRLPFTDWDFPLENGNEMQRRAFSDFLKENKPQLTFLTEDGDYIFIVEVSRASMFDGDGPDADDEIFFLFPEASKGPEDLRLFIMLKTNEGWPDYHEYGEFICQLS